MLSLALDYFLWWYTEGIARFLKYCRAYIMLLVDTFSVRILITTLFQPWRRDITSTKGLSLDKRFGIWMFNLIARFFGAIIKTITFCVFLICFAFLLAAEFVLFSLWIFYPAVVFAIFIYFLTDIFA